jgi:outer membrane protein OmpA-like peptidoglycan-associated protein
MVMIKWNLQLSKERANAVKTYLISKGVSEKQMTAIGYGETRPIAENTDASGKQQNRRTEIQILKK